jgi:glycosyl transferase family 2
MGIPESDISILIPTYKYRDKVVRALESALASRAGEIIVIEDCGHDGTIERLTAYSDPRLTVIGNARNLGLWENHLKALRLATKPWIKFIQADDYLLPGGLAKYAAVADVGVTVISGAPVLKDDQTGATSLTYTLSRPLQLDWPAFEAMCLRFGNFLGSPSYMMLRADAIERDPALWRTCMSSDMLVGAIAAARGSVMVLPPGAIGHGVHLLQDAKTQGTARGLARMANSLVYLRARPEPELRRLANLWTCLNTRPMLKTLVRGLMLREVSPASLMEPMWRMIADISCADWREIGAARATLGAARRARSTMATPFDLDNVLAEAFASLEGQRFVDRQR